mgnify:CR=1 FL=1|tara:strand:- start:2068 stop:2673 length:606 start_codon:yes stop_codon:yes gene_type:complete
MTDSKVRPIPTTAHTYVPDVGWARSPDPVFHPDGTDYTVCAETIFGLDVLVLRTRTSSPGDFLTFADHEPVGQPIYVVWESHWHAVQSVGHWQGGQTFGYAFAPATLGMPINPACTICKGLGYRGQGCGHCLVGIQTKPTKDFSDFVVGREEHTGFEWVSSVFWDSRVLLNISARNRDRGITYTRVSIADWYAKHPVVGER